MKKYVLFAFIALFFVSSFVWAGTAYVKVTDGGMVSCIPIKGTINGTNIEIGNGSNSAISNYTIGAIDLNEVWSQSDGSGTHYQVTSIGDYAFYGCSSLTSIDIPNSVKSIGGCAFEQCSGLTSVIIGNGVTSIGNYAFYYCSGLTSITIPNSVITLGWEAFGGCTGLSSITIPASVTTIEGATFNFCSGLTSIEFLNGVIGPSMFTECEGLTSVVIPSNITSIGDYAFSRCWNLTSVSLPSSVKSIGSYVFDDCGALKSITSYITDVFETDPYAFYGSTNATLYVPKGLVDAYRSTADWSSFSNIVEMSNNQYDVNNDGSVDISDVVALVNAILSSSTTDSSYDVNGDGSVDISDVVSLVNTILNGTGTGSDDNSQVYLTCPDDNHPHMIDLGLPSGTKWACCNVGADKPEAYGGYYAWGETHEKSEYTLENYKYYNISTGDFANLGSSICGTEYDVAHVKWGGSWVMPSEEQIEEMLRNCTYEWTEINGFYGGKFTNQTNGGSIFLPAAGNHTNSDLNNAGSVGYYWSSTQSSFLSDAAYKLGFFSDTGFLQIDGRSGGFSVRPVSK